MNRNIIKFRVWDGKNLHILDKDYYYLQFNSIDNWMLFFRNQGIDTKIADAFDEKSIIQQYTGFKDKNLKDICDFSHE